MNKKITLLLVCTLFAFSSVFSQNTNRIAVAGDGTYTVTLTETIPAGHTAKFYAGQSSYVDGFATFSLNTPGQMGVVINGVVGEYYVDVGYKLFKDSDNTEHSAHVVEVRVGDLTNPIINLIGAASQTIFMGGSPTLGATSTDVIDNHSDVLNVTEDLNGLDVNSAGTYSILYNVSDLSGNPADQVTRTVTVVDNVNPVITLNTPGTQTLEVEDSYTELGATASDNNDGNNLVVTNIDATSVVVGTIGTYSVTYNFTDASGNPATQVARTVEVVDTTSPTAIAIAGPIVINLNGVTTITEQDVNDGSSDNYVAGGITLSLNKSSFTCSDLGGNTITLTVTDSSNNSAQATVLVNVIDDAAPLNVALVNPSYVHPTGTPYVEQGFTQDEVCPNGYIIVSSDLNVNQWGTYTIVYKVVDTAGNESLPITRTQVVNNVPTTNVESFTVNQDTSNHIFDVLVGDSFGADGYKSFTITTTTPNGTLILNDAGTPANPTDDTLTYSPRSTYNGSDSFTYTLEDENGDTAVRTINITVHPIVPVPVNDVVSFNKNSSNNIISVLSNDDFGGNGANTTHPLTFTNGSTTSASVHGGAISVGDNGTPTNLTDDVIIYTPAANYVGQDSFQYTLTDFDGDATTASVTITVVEGSNGNTVPTAVADPSVAVNQDSSNNVINVLANDSAGLDGFIDGGLTMTNGTLNGGSTNGGTINVDNKSTATTSDDVINYTPKAGFSGTDTFNYTITDASGDASTATVTVNVGITNVPTAVADTATAAQDSSNNIIAVLTNDNFGTDGPAGTPIALPNAVTTAGGAVSLDVNNDVLYTPLTTYSGVDTFTYTIEDANGDISSATVTITVGVVLVPSSNPTAVADTAIANQNSSSNTINVLFNDSFGSDGASTTHPLTFKSGSKTSASTKGGAISITDNGTPLILTDDVVKYSPAKDYVGVDTFEYVITDTSGDASTATVTITVSASGAVSVPTAVNDSANVAQDSSNNVIDVLFNDHFGLDGAIDGGLTMTNGSLTSASANGGTISVDNKSTATTSDDEFKYSPKAGFIGVDTFNYTITDASGDASTAIVTITVSALPPLGYSPDSATVNQNSTNTEIDILANDDVSVFGPTSTRFLIESVDHITGTTQHGGIVTLNTKNTPNDTSDDVINYSPAVGFVGVDTFNYVPGIDSNALVLVTITVEAVAIVNGTPTAMADSNVTVNKNSSNNIIAVLSNDSFGSDGPSATHPLTMTNGGLSNASANGGAISVGDNGTPTNLSDDVIIYTPPTDYNGVDTFNYVITDANGDASTGVVTIAIVVPKGLVKTKMVKEKNQIFNNNFSVYPNPSKGTVTSTLFSSIKTKANVVLLDITGKVVYNSKVQLNKGKNEIGINVQVKPGIMILQIFSSEINYGFSKIIFK